MMTMTNYVNYVNENGENNDKEDNDNDDMNHEFADNKTQRTSEMVTNYRNNQAMCHGCYLTTELSLVTYTIYMT